MQRSIDSRQRTARDERQPAGVTRPARWRTALAALLVLAGIGLFLFGHRWAPLALALLPDSPAGLWLELLVPFLPMAFVAGGAYLFVSDRR